MTKALEHRTKEERKNAVAAECSRNTGKLPPLDRTMINMENDSTQNEHIVGQYVNQNYDQMQSHREEHSYSTFKKKPYYMETEKIGKKKEI